MLKINKKIIIISIVVAVVTLFLFLMIQSQPKTDRSKEEIALEYEYGKFIQDEIIKNPFISKLPIKNGEYIILYSSIKQQIVVIFYDKTETVENLKLRFQPEIDRTLIEIGLDLDSIIVNWEIVK
ncbi:hypothetical protein A2130_04920 [Candidatus Woesebacteria bacterium GWC2_33_12]|uniref:Uncharacterized protein n=1 Tax=Candidatus Woesebacteria bacterium GW2011_GWB1_33_22 TaxID=1618566 RepID=A0A0G0C0E4_9BACT|nr:MAG: hypothetical protein UR29_C0011G0016 [Candidatus Woesebacteria bacterium GW2011_GWC2_33_12]KKP41948.1 MAG: hypothetical protein UR33_C0007G0011 [Candidatus Woesebacteria bacterium GW2011_GWA2_33_20]KKP44615.1 MAG: hypothetical protein UR35_C0007G0031 [Candidatus Woesebacteria bacterium GW2011_GWB1_33_22]KKP46419.1 MAG: hypothetical protein UR37_C0008G0031 [Microgenomates group bacterium GW2011_GWC1_33_28]KKP50473.1 MAG: hypothetical protein UR41_C0007G0031 [Candidatus Woesebacteria bact